MICEASLPRFYEGGGEGSCGSNICVGELRTL